MGELTYRMASSEDRLKAESKLRSEGIAVPPITEDTIVAVDDQDEIIAFASLRNIPFLYLHFNENLGGHKAAMRLPEMADFILKTRGIREVFMGVDRRVPTMVKAAERFGFTWWGEGLYHKWIDPIIKKVANGPVKRLK